MSAGPSSGVAAGTPVPLTVALDRDLAPALAEVKYALRTLLRIAGYGCRYVWSDAGVTPHLVYGRATVPGALLHIPAAGHDFHSASMVDATGSRTWHDLPFLTFPGEEWRGDALGSWPVDAVFATFWLLTGAREATWPRDRWDNLDASGWVLVRDRLLSQAPVSRWARAIREVAAGQGLPPLPMPWESGATRAAFSFTHDVDYPEIIRWIEAPRLLARRGIRGIGPAVGVLRGSNHFWTFREWMEFEHELGARPTFYFMARQGSLLRYALGRPDDFYDVRSPRFQGLFAELRGAGAEVGLHASYLAHQSAETIRVEAERVSHAAEVPVIGNRHHYWHLDPDDPNETLRRHELAGLQYDSSLGLEFYPGFRRGVCHPFRPFHPGERRELDTVQIPPAWMDDHFDRRLAVNGIRDPDAAASEILGTVRATGGVAVVDYHSRGMNADFYPRYGPWLQRFARRELGSDLAMRTPGDLLAEYLAVERQLDLASADEATVPAPAPAVGQPRFEVGPLVAADAREVALLHQSLFGDPDFNGHSVATLGLPFLEQAFYRLNIDNPGLHALVAKAEGRVVGFFVYATERQGALAHLARRHPGGLAFAALRSVATRPAALGGFVANLRYFGGETLPFLADVPAWCVVIGVHPDARSRRFESRVGARVAVALFDAAEEQLRRAGCSAWYVAVRPDNAAVQALLRRRGAALAGTAVAQGLEMAYYVKRFVPGGAVAGGSSAS